MVTMDLDIEQYNYDLNGNLEHCIQVLAGVATQCIDTPVTRSSILYENSDLISFPSSDEPQTFPARVDISRYLDDAPSNGIPNKLRGIPILFGITVISHISSYLLDRVIPNAQSQTSSNDENPGGLLRSHRYCYSTSMHFYRKCKLQNMAVTVPTNQVVDADAIPPGAAVPDPVPVAQHQHDWDHRGLLRKIVISSLSSLLTYPLRSIYVRIAFDLGTPSPSISKMGNKKSAENAVSECGVDYKYPISPFCGNVTEIGKQIVSESDHRILSLFKGFGLSLLSNVLYQTLLHYSREILIHFSPRIHSYKLIDRFVSKRKDPFEYSMFCIWWTPPILCRLVVYPLIKMQNRAIIGGAGNGMDQLVTDSVTDSVTSWSAKVGSMMKRMFHGVVGNTTRFMTEIQMVGHIAIFLVFFVDISQIGLY